MLDKENYRIAVTMNDSDFRGTLDAFLRVIAGACIYPDHLEAKLLWQHLAYGLCLANQDMHHGPLSAEKNEWTEKYMLEQFEVRINDTVDRHYKRYEGDDNGETSVYDTRRQAGQQIYSY